MSFVEAGKLKNSSVKVLIAANCVPLLGVLFLEWSVAAILLIYWCENVVIGFYTILKLLTNEYTGKESMKMGGEPVDNRNPLIKIWLTVFFLFHYGMFTFGHLIFLLVLITLVFSVRGESLIGLAAVVLMGALPLVVSHGVSFYNNYYKGSEKKTMPLSKVMFMPYPRIIVMHVSIVLGFFLIFVLGGFGVALLLIGLKTTVDVVAHLSERKRASARRRLSPFK